MTHALPAPEPKPPYRPPDLWAAPLATSWIVPHRRTWDDLQRALRDGAEAAGFRAYLGHSLEPSDFEWVSDEKLDPSTQRCLDLCGLMEFQAADHLILIDTNDHWRDMLTDPSTQRRARAACRSLCDALGGGRRVIFCPCEQWEDYYIHQYRSDYCRRVASPGTTMADAEAHLLGRVGPPAASLSSILRREPDGRRIGDGYVVDTLSD